MSDPIELPVDSDGEHLVEPPIVDELQWDTARQVWLITFVPEESVSVHEKEVVEVLPDTSEGRRIKLRVDRLSRLLGQKLQYVVHSGDGNFSFHSASGGTIELAEPHARFDLSLRAYVELTDIAMTAQIAFLATRGAARV